MTESRQSGERVIIQDQMNEGFGENRDQEPHGKEAIGEKQRLFSMPRTIPARRQAKPPLGLRRKRADHQKTTWTLLAPLLGRTAKKKRPGLDSATPQDIAETWPGRINFPAKGHKIITQLLPVTRLGGCTRKTQIIPMTQGPVAALKPT